MLHGVALQTDWVAEFGQADKPAPHAAIVPCCAKSCQALAAANQTCIGSNAELGEAAVVICPKGVKFPKGERLVAAARNASNGSLDRPADVAVPGVQSPNHIGQNAGAVAVCRPSGVISLWRRLCHATAAATEAWLISKNTSVAFRRKRKWRSKSNKEVIPQSLSISVLLHRSNNAGLRVCEPGRSPTAAFAELAQHSACGLEQRRRPKWLRLL